MSSVLTDLTNVGWVESDAENAISAIPTILSVTSRDPNNTDNYSALWNTDADFEIEASIKFTSAPTSGLEQVVRIGNSAAPIYGPDDNYLQLLITLTAANTANFKIWNYSVPEGVAWEQVVGATTFNPNVKQFFTFSRLSGILSATRWTNSSMDIVAETITTPTVNNDTFTYINMAGGPGSGVYPTTFTVSDFALRTFNPVVFPLLPFHDDFTETDTARQSLLVESNTEVFADLDRETTSDAHLTQAWGTTTDFKITFSWDFSTVVDNAVGAFFDVNTRAGDLATTPNTDFIRLSMNNGGGVTNVAIQSLASSVLTGNVSFTTPISIGNRYWFEVERVGDIVSAKKYVQANKLDTPEEISISGTITPVGGYTHFNLLVPLSNAGGTGINLTGTLYDLTLEQITSTPLTTKWDINEEVSFDFTLKWTIDEEIVALRDLTVLWNSAGITQKDLPILWSLNFTGDYFEVGHFTSGSVVEFKIISRDGTVVQNWSSIGVREVQPDAGIPKSTYNVDYPIEDGFKGTIHFRNSAESRLSFDVINKDDTIISTVNTIDTKIDTIRR